ncbi:MULTISPECIES: peptidyl-tRNA hydrolase [unclassified Streptomyces]|uniref:peptidyl-tRNA hydrolase n=1 Tax=unclassified Streptomyces TaxID=2593676 RepID=UPI00168A47D5|nr:MULTISPECIES: peptidyl-tRNA hydrolase [unclassified Streptomyces]MBD3011117.1 peptidyl-tRNA hydrolase [Streptomyces sp. 5-10]
MTSTDADTETGTQTTAHQGTGSGARSSPFRHAEVDRDAAPQFVLPLVVRIEKAAPPARTDALETAARAVLVLLSDERATAADGEWAQAVRDWQDARIRKVVRRARGAEWRRASGLPGITVTGRAPAADDGDERASVDGAASADGASSAAAEVRVFPPVPLDGWPKELAKLQVSGTDLDDPEPPPAPDPSGPVLWLSPHVEMSAGKAMAQAGHGAQLAWWELDDAARAAWREAGFPLAVRTASAERWDELTASGLPVVRDAGFTEIAPGSCTVVADHPALRRR